jgi:lipid II:glycine glycyltransferase (peptidoglycan interpeptide bridge formation enzyme)
MTAQNSVYLERRYAGHGLVETVVNVGYQVRVSQETEDPDWDAFVAETAGGHHVQTSLWAQVKASLGWRAARVVVTQDEHIVAGAQVLMRRLPLAGAIGYVPRGPLCAVDDPGLIKLVINGLHQIAGDHRVQYLVVQPPGNGQTLARQLPCWGFRPSAIRGVQPPATVLIDLRMDLDDILAQMKKKTRYSIRRGLREGITVREGTAEDLPTFYRLMVATSQRQQFSLYPEAYFVEMWRVLHPHGYIRLFVAEYAGEAVSAFLVVPFGDTVVSKVGGWSGCHGRRKPNEVLDWAVIRWAKSHGYCYYDFEGIDPLAARALTDGESLPNSLHQTPTSYKLGFGGQVTLFPPAYDYVYNPLLRWVHTMVSPKIASSSLVKNALSRLRTR